MYEETMKNKQHPFIDYTTLPSRQLVLFFFLSHGRSARNRAVNCEYTQRQE